ncbi:hypothetical protein H0H93_016886 [Arthromyces matolae]|nr:hypothetical protein H0H93_016886 [Arthromyces matolae]
MANIDFSYVFFSDSVSTQPHPSLPPPSFQAQAQAQPHPSLPLPSLQAHPHPLPSFQAHPHPPPLFQAQAQAQAHPSLPPPSLQDHPHPPPLFQAQAQGQPPPSSTASPTPQLTLNAGLPHTTGVTHGVTPSYHPQTLPSASTASAPIQTLYPSSRALPPLPPLPVLSMQTATPTLTFSGQTNIMNGSLASANANQARVASANATLPRRPARARRGNNRFGGPQTDTPRGASTSALTLSRPASSNGAHICLEQNGSVLRIEVRVSPPQPIGPGHHTRYVMHKYVAEYRAELMKWGLLFLLEASVTMSLADMAQSIATAMQSSPFSYQFDPALGQASHFHILACVNGGNPSRTADHQVRLHANPITLDMTVGSLLEDKKYSNGLCVMISDKRLIVHLGVARWPLTFVHEGRLHRCHTERFLALFPSDVQSEESADGWECSSEGEALDTQDLANDADDEQSIADTLTAEDVNVNPGLISEPSVAVLSAQSLPPRLIGWGASSTPWTPPPLISAPAPYITSTIKERIYGEASYGSGEPPLVIEGETVDDMAMSLYQLIREAVISNDFTKVLAQNRSFIRNGSTYSRGQGVEAEVFEAVTKHFVNASNWQQFFKEMENGYYSLQCLMPMTSHVSQSRLIDMACLGAIFALTFLQGKVLSLPFSRSNCGNPISPALFLFIVYDFDIGCLTPSFIGEYYPGLCTDILAWQDLGPSGNPIAFQSRFASYHDTQALRAFRGGPEAFIRLISTTAQTVEDVIPYLQINSTVEIRQEFMILRTTLGQTTIRYESIIHEYLRGEGIPIPSNQATLVELFGRYIDFEQASNPMFRTRMLLWAATGSPYLTNYQTEGSIAIWAVADDDEQYITLGELGRQLNVQRVNNHESPYSPAERDIAATNARAQMIKNGVISFRTCFQMMRFPASFIMSMARATYDPAEEPNSFQQAFDNWLFLGCITAIGQHSMA